jgi:hypothetical protein
MWVRHSSDKQCQQDPEWLRELEKFLNENGNKEKFEMVKNIFVEAYFENIRDGVNSKEAFAKSEIGCVMFFDIALMT